MTFDRIPFTFHKNKPSFFLFKNRIWSPLLTPLPTLLLHGRSEGISMCNLKMAWGCVARHMRVCLFACLLRMHSQCTRCQRHNRFNVWEWSGAASLLDLRSCRTHRSGGIGVERVIRVIHDRSKGARTACAAAWSSFPNALISYKPVRRIACNAPTPAAENLDVLIKRLRVTSKVRLEQWLFEDDVGSSVDHIGAIVCIDRIWRPSKEEV